ncbi:MAG TPA: hypothetical protein PLP98_06865 [Plasticicumulans sp.]|nr:hypothetical protein [Plasticicumulans sp.]
MQPSNPGGTPFSGTVSLNLPNQKPDISSAASRKLTPSEIESLRLDKQRASEEIRRILDDDGSA